MGFRRCTISRMKISSALRNRATFSISARLRNSRISMDREWGSSSAMGTAETLFCVSQR